MNFSNYSVKQFCNEVYALNESPYSISEISSLEMYQFIKEKTNSFDYDSMSYFISDIRNYYNNIKFSIPNPEPEPESEYEIDECTGYPRCINEELLDKYESLLRGSLNELDLFFDFNIHVDFTEEQTLRDKVNLFNKLLPGALISHDISNLFKFSDIAEKEYERVSSLTISNVGDETYIPSIQTIWNNLEDLTSAYYRFNKLLKCDLKTWLFWFGDYPIENPKQIKWIYKKGMKRALTYFIHKISLSEKIDYAQTSKIFDIQVKPNDKYVFSFEEIDNLIG